MTSDQIIAKLLPLEGDDFRRAIGEFGCVLAGGNLYHWDTGVKSYGNSLAELAFELMRTCDNYDYIAAMKLVHSKVPSLYEFEQWAITSACESERIIAAIATLEGE